MKCKGISQLPAVIKWLGICLLICIATQVQSQTIDGVVVSNISGAIYTTGPNGTSVNLNQYPKKADVYLNGGPQNDSGSGLPDGLYYFQVTNTSGSVLLSTDPATCRQLQVIGGKVMGAYGPCPHANGVPDQANGSIGVQLIPFNDSGNGIYKVYLIPKESATIKPDGIGLEFTESKSDNFSILCSPPVITCPGDVQIACGGSTDPAQTGRPTVNGGCGQVALTYSDEVTVQTCPKTIVRTWTATDEDGQTDTCTQTLTTAADTTPPVISTTLPATVNVECVGDVPAADVTKIRATDECDPAPVVTVADVTSGTDCKKTITRTYTATDECGNASTWVQTINVEDKTPPVITSDLPATDSAECSAAGPDISKIHATDNCGGPVTVTSDDVITGTACEKTITRTYTATDQCGNKSTWVQTISVEDKTGPSIDSQLPATVNVECMGEVPAPDVSKINATDACGGPVVVTSADVTSGTDCKKTITRTYTATDECGNASTWVQTICVEDKTAPQITTDLPATVNVQCPDDVPAADTSKITAIDNCGGAASVTSADVVVGTECKKTITRTYTAEDSCGNKSTWVQTINVEDTEGPEITAGDITTLSWGADCTKLVDVPYTLKDNCDPRPTAVLTRSDGKAMTDPFPGSLEGTVTKVTITAKDACGNESTKEISVTVKCLPVHTIGGFKYYDANANYKIDAGDTVIEGLKVEVCWWMPMPDATTVTGCGIATTDSTGMWMAELPEGASFTACEILPPTNWVQTGPSAGDTVVSSLDPLVILATATESGCWTGTVDSEPILGLNFLNLCVESPSGGFTKGWWGNKNGMDVLKLNDPAWRTIANDLNLKRESGADFDVSLLGSFTNCYRPFDEWLKNSRAVNMAYMLSAQLVTTRLDVAYMGLDGGVRIFLPKGLLACIGASDTGAPTIMQVIDLANAELGLPDHNVATAESGFKTYQGCLETILDGINNNRWMFLPDVQCPLEYPVQP